MYRPTNKPAVTGSAYPESPQARTQRVSLEAIRLSGFAHHKNLFFKGNTMKTNVGSADRIIRIVIGLVLLSLPFWVHASWSWVGLVGIIPLVTGFARRCPAYDLLGVNTCSSCATKK